MKFRKLNCFSFVQALFSLDCFEIIWENAYGILAEMCAEVSNKKTSIMEKISA